MYEETTAISTANKSGKYAPQATCELVYKGEFAGYLNISGDYESDAEGLQVAKDFCAAIAEMSTEQLATIRASKTKSGIRFVKANNQTVGFSNNFKPNNPEQYSFADFVFTPHERLPKNKAGILRWLTA